MSVPAFSAPTVPVETLRESEARFRQLADAMPQIVWTAGPDGILNYTNRRWYEFLNRTEAEVSPQDWHLSVHADDIAGVAKVWTDAVGSGKPYATEFRLQRGDGAYRWFLVRALPVLRADGAVTQWYGTCTDIHDQRALLEQNAALLKSERVARIEAEDASRMKDEFLATLSHELRTPLNAILGWSSLLRADPATRNSVADGLAIIERNARVQNRIIDDHLDMSRIISGKVRLDVHRIDLAPIVEAALETVRLAAEAKGIRLESALDAAAPPVSGDPNRLQQIFWNLLSNAIKFTPRDGCVRVVLECLNAQIEVSVADNGNGIEADFLPYVFDRFRQADSSTSRQHGGLGLGLAIVKQLTELHGGTVRCASGGAGLGAIFIISLPLTPLRMDYAAEEGRRYPDAADMKVPALDSDVHLQGVRVLVLDDESDARTLIKVMLEGRGASVAMNSTAGEALQMLQTLPFDVLISDIGMPGEDGYSFIRKVRAMRAEQNGAIPAIALTAYARSEDRMNAVLAGFQMHMTKPVEPAELLAMVASLAGRAGQAPR